MDFLTFNKNSLKSIKLRHSVTIPGGATLKTGQSEYSALYSQTNVKN